MPATSAVPRCVASSPLKNRFPGSVGRSSVPAWLAGCHPSAAFRRPEGVACPLAELPAPAVQHIGVHFKCPCHLGNRRPRLQPLDCGHFHVTPERSSKQSHDTILHLPKIVS